MSNFSCTNLAPLTNLDQKSLLPSTNLVIEYTPSISHLKAANCETVFYNCYGIKDTLGQAVCPGCRLAFSQRVEGLASLCNI